MNDAGASKLCTSCGVDVATSKRTKDCQGRYWCMPCFESAMASQQARQDAGPTLACASCGASMPADAVVCTQCGYNTRSGRAASTKVRQAKETGVATKAAAAVARSWPVAMVLATIGAGAAGLVSAIAWAIVALLTGYELSILAILVGGLVGLGAMFGARGHTGVISGVIASGVSIVAICAGRLAAYIVVYNERGVDLAFSEWDKPTAIFMIVAVLAAAAVGSRGELSLLGGDDDRW